MPAAPQSPALAASELRELATRTRQHLSSGQQTLTAAWRQKKNGAALLAGRAALVDNVLQTVWAALAMPTDCALAAVGGYGRGELYPGSDVDLLILLPDDSHGAAESCTTSRLEQLIGLLWDIGLDIGHSVRSVNQCLDEAERDITVKTALLEARYLAGARTLYDDFEQSYNASLEPAAFFTAKHLEQAERYAKFNDTPYSLEPNCKESPGGRRDLQVIQWVARAAGIGDDWNALAQAGLITVAEVRQFVRADRLLCDLRIELHLLVGRREDRLLFDHQENLASAMGIGPTETKRASEVLMQRYYQNAKLVTQLNALVLQILADRLQPARQGPPIVIDEHFQMIREQLDVREEDVFQRYPRAILECFLLQMQRSEIKGLTPRTLRALWRAQGCIDAGFRRDPENRALFLKLFQQQHLIHPLRRMNQYDILGRYLPAFGRIVGQMQHDLFHVYTVDQHILQVMRNLRRFAMPEFAHEYPFCSRLMAGFENRWLLYVAALFHDIAKGRGGDHSQLGKQDAARFCRDHGITGNDADLVGFLVEQHLSMSQVAQKQDLADPEVILAFARRVGDLRRLTALYLLTVADIRGTSPKVWNAWKGKLLEDLFRMTAGVLSGTAALQLTGVSERQEEARGILRYHGLRPDVELDLWSQLDTGYFIRHTAEEIAWHTRTLYYRPAGAKPVVRARLNPMGDGLQVMVYVPDQAFLFARLCGYFARLGYSIVDAKIHTTRHGYALDSFVVFAFNGDQAYRDMTALIEHDIGEQLEQQPPLPAAVSGRLSRQVRHFPVTPEVDIRADERGNQYLMAINAADRPGLLYAIARVLGRHGITLHTAKIATLGERVEDVFLISGKELAQTATLVRLEQDLLAALQV
ncbi:MAG: [protein-PII] uridylyltransferase [Rhodocyclales bacterium RIFCSPLOWO2_02_FULL_63_24]|nr:MAG: [protein-PII] uridylyltransferase [Rhodocyclales bacterium GWA2_65_19]OHC71138.1 MAG: [protein-PII] uridylyltransferase [Rhodocyclales bacterium RIFCSPLOWO2_02_FULL_63_24]